MTAPRRIQLQRRRGWRLAAQSAGARVVARPHKWGNPFTIAHHGRQGAIDRYREALLAGQLPLTVDDVRRELAGRDLACWCPLTLPCHADVLLEIANHESKETQ